MAAFISYRFTEDRNKYEDICYAFDREGIKYWSTGEIAAGQSLRAKLQSAIRQCSVCVFIATSKSLESGWCQAEIGAFWGLGRPVVVYLADDKLTEDDLPRQFVGDKFASTIREVVDAVKIHVSQPPETSQTEAIFSLAIESFLDKLTLQFKTHWFLGFGTLAPGLGREPNASVRSANAFGERVSYEPTKPRVDATSELRAVIKRIANFRERRKRKIEKTLLTLFTGVQGQAQSISNRLSRIPFGSATLSEPWRRAQERLVQLWDEKSKDLACFGSDELDRLQLFLEEHPAYQEVYAEEKMTVDSFLRPGLVSLDELIEMTANQLGQSMKELLVEQP
jgi:hypothetical protein